MWYDAVRKRARPLRRGVAVLGLLPLLCGWLLPGQPADLVMVQHGTLPILLTAPHGGSLEVPGVPPRTTGTTTADARTRELTEALAERLEAQLCARPYVVIALFHRRSIDANRPEAEAYESPTAQPYYLAYHQSVRRLVDDIRSQYSEGGLLLDVHGQSDEPEVIHRGTRDGQTTTRLLQRHGPEALTSPNSLFGMLSATGYLVFPPNTPLRTPPEDRRFNGGHTVFSYGSHLPDGIDAIQLEIGATMRQADRLAAFVEDLAAAIAVAYRAYVRDVPPCAIEG